MRLHLPKTCGCGRVHYTVGETFKLFLDELLGGYYWDCVCRSTLFAPTDEVESIPNERKAA